MMVKPLSGPPTFADAKRGFANEDPISASRMMGAVESTQQLSPTSPQLVSDNFLQPGGALHTLLNIVKPLPSDPEDPFYTTLFHDYLLAHHVAPRSLSQLTTAALNLPSGPHAVALVAALRAAVHRMRSDESAPLLGALLLTRAVLVNLRRAAPDDLVCLVLGAGDAERSLCPSDRIDLGRSLVARLINSALDLLHNDNPAVSPHVALAAIDLLLVALGDELYARSTQSEPFSSLLDRYTYPEQVVVSLLDVIADASNSIDPDLLLNIGTEHLSSTDQASKRPVNLTLVASASALALQTGVSDALSAISSRLPFASFSKDTSDQEPESQSRSATAHGSDGPQQGVSYEKVHFPDPHSDPYALFIPETPRAHSAPSTEFDVDTQLVMADLTKRDGPESRHNLSQVSNGGSVANMPGRVLTTSSSQPEKVAQSAALLAEHALIILCILCGPRSDSPYRKALCELQNKSPTSKLTIGYPFSKLYEMLGKWLLHPNMALLAYYLMIGNKRFQRFALARTDPDVLVVPLLASLRRRCYIGVAPSDAYIPAVIMLTLTSDKGFCEAIDAISVSPSWLTWIEDKGRLGNEEVSLSGIVVLICSRVVQQSLVVRRKEPECFLTSVCLGVMANISGDITKLHPLAAERLVSLLEFLGRRRRKAILCAKRGNDMPMAPPRIGGSPRLEGYGREKLGRESLKSGYLEKREEFVELLTEYVGLCLEMIVSVLRSRSSVSANRHLVYTLLHREAVLENEFVTHGSDQTVALSHMVRRMVEFFGKLVDQWSEESVDNHGRRSQGISVERVFEVIDENARHLRRDVFDGLPDMHLCFEEMELGGEFLRAYSWSLAARRMHLFCNVDKTVMPISLPCFQPSQ